MVTEQCSAALPSVIRRPIQQVVSLMDALMGRFAPDYGKENLDSSQAVITIAV